MGSASGRKWGEETSSWGREIEEIHDDHQAMEYFVDGGGAPLSGYPAHHAFSDPMAQFFPYQPGFRAHPSSPFTIPTHQDPDLPLSRPETLMIRPQALVPAENMTRVRISWNHGGTQVAIRGSWDSWQTCEILQRTSRNFSIVKTLPLGIYRYHFVVDNRALYAPDLPCSSDDSGHPCNILDLQERVSELPENLHEFEIPSSPEPSYGQEFLTEEDFSKPPPNLPPQLEFAFLNEIQQPSSSSSSTLDGQQSVTTASQHTHLNHLYVHTNVEERYMALGSTQRFRQKLVSMMLFKPLTRTQ